MSLRLTPDGTARERIRRAADPAFPADLLAAASAFEDGVEQLYLAWELARCIPGLLAPERRALLLLTLSSLIASHEGSTRLPLRGMKGAALFEPILQQLGATQADRDLIDRFIDDTADSMPTMVSDVLGHVGELKPLVTDGMWLTNARLFHFEHRVAASLIRRLAQPLAGDELRIEAALQAAMRQTSIPLSTEQQAAVRRTLRAPLTVITGGPGTGKTSIIISVVQALVRTGVPASAIALAAPTGRAAHRMEESIQRYAVDREQTPKPQTLHRLLRYSPTTDRFFHHEHNQLTEEVVIVDESSMVDLFLMDQLLRAIRPEARLVLLGDAEQLPSVEAGAVFRDLAQASGAVRLTESYRMDPKDPAGRNILSVARAVNTAETSGLFEAASGRETVVVRASAAEVAFEKVELLESGAAPFLERWYSETIRGPDGFAALIRKTYHSGPEGFPGDDTRDLRLLFRHFESFRLLCLTKGEAPLSGAAAVNAAFHAKALHDWRSEQWRGSPDFLPGEPILLHRNDYERGLFNGDQGLVLRVANAGDERSHFTAVFPRDGGFVAHHLEGLRDVITLAYAMTVHKAQGSEFDRIGLLLPPADVPLLTRELLYTALTRSRRSVVIVGAREMLLRGSQKRTERFSGIAEALASVR